MFPRYLGISWMGFRLVTLSIQRSSIASEDRVQHQAGDGTIHNEMAAALITPDHGE